MKGIQQITTLPELPARKRDAHKGDFGRVLVVGGSQGMIGAPSLAANAAFRGGAGLVTLAVGEDIQQAAAGLCPCATSIALSCDENSVLTRIGIRQVLQAAERNDVIAVGPGMGCTVDRRNLVRAVLSQTKPVVLDADGLNNLTEVNQWATLRSCPMVITPHPGEFARLCDLSIGQIQAQREKAAVDYTRLWGGDGGLPFVCVLKGAGTVVTDGLRLYVNKTGNPGMATGGSGDVLTGLIAALIGQGLGLFEAACLGVYLHGLAGDIAAEVFGEVSLMASDLLDHLPAAIKGIVR